MNSYILTFKRKIFLSLFLVFFGFVLLDIALFIQANRMTTKNSYIIGNKSSQSKFFELNQFYNKDIIFVGSSRTYYHISTNMFKNNNINIFNFGMSGNQFEDYPDAINTIKKYNPKKVVISLSVNRLYENLNKVKNPTLIDLKYYFDTDKILFINGLISYLKSFHIFLTYSEAIFYRINSFYNKFNINKQINVSSNIKSNDNIEHYADCEVYDIKKNPDGNSNLKCKNGDGILVGNSIKEEFVNKSIELKNLNKNTISYITNGIINPLLQKNIEVTIILEPIFKANYNYDIKEIVNKFKNVKIVDLTQFHILNEKWADNGHLNNFGRHYYSKYLIELYKNNSL
ncbi:hypothetical protein [Aliarcobacter cryaerophilus]|uniref:hypothetical protein n=1 Tax=Aliarcobacter cryaerophilus TaxID=28198 RepID=UPI0021B4F95A|nr:hypothetical protein [Aliarcobacter cryaerophilus]